jgi:DNA-binding NarL/FixJ family response regulator
LWTENLFLSKDSPLGRPRNRPLTPREEEVAALVAKGLKNREIAEALNIATGTVKIHLMHIFEKTGIRDRFELALQGLRLACERSLEETADLSAQQTPQRETTLQSQPISFQTD